MSEPGGIRDSIPALAEIAWSVTTLDSNGMGHSRELAATRGSEQSLPSGQPLSCGVHPCAAINSRGQSRIARDTRGGGGGGEESFLASLLGGGNRAGIARGVRRTAIYRVRQEGNEKAT